MKKYRKASNPNRRDFVQENMKMEPTYPKRNMNSTLSTFSGKNADIGMTKYNSTFVNEENFSILANRTLQNRFRSKS